MKSVYVGLFAVLAVLAVPSLVLAAPGDPEPMGAIVFPVTISSIVAAVVTAGGALLVAWFGLAAGFKLIRRFFSRTTRAV